MLKFLPMPNVSSLFSSGLSSATTVGKQLGSMALNRMSNSRCSQFFMQQNTVWYPTLCLWAEDEGSALLCEMDRHFVTITALISLQIYTAVIVEEKDSRAPDIFYRRDDVQRGVAHVYLRDVYT